MGKDGVIYVRAGMERLWLQSVEGTQTEKRAALLHAWFTTPFPTGLRLILIFGGKESK